MNHDKIIPARDSKQHHDFVPGSARLREYGSSNKANDAKNTIQIRLFEGVWFANYLSSLPLCAWCGLAKRGYGIGDSWVHVA